MVYLFQTHVKVVRSQCSAKCLKTVVPFLKFIACMKYEPIRFETNLKIFNPLRQSFSIEQNRFFNNISFLADQCGTSCFSLMLLRKEPLAPANQMFLGIVILSKIIRSNFSALLSRTCVYWQKKKI